MQKHNHSKTHHLPVRKFSLSVQAIRQLLERLEQRYQVFSFEDNSIINENDFEREIQMMERLDSQFHKYDIVKAILGEIDHIFTTQIINKLEKQSDSIFEIFSSNSDLINQLSSIPRFEQLLSEISIELDRLILECKECNWNFSKVHSTKEVNSGRKNTSKKPRHKPTISVNSDFLHSEKHTALTVSTIDDDLWDTFQNSATTDPFPFNQTSSLQSKTNAFTTQVTDPNIDTETKLKAIDDLLGMFVGDWLGNEYEILDGLKIGLCDNSTLVVSKCLETLKSLFKVVAPDIASDIYLCLTEHLISLGISNELKEGNAIFTEIFESNPVYLEKYKTLIKFQFYIFRNNLQIANKALKNVLLKTFQLFSLPTAYLFISYIDTEAEWFSFWSKEYKLRKILFNSIKKTPSFISNVTNYLKVDDDNFQNDSERKFKYFLYVHSSNICASLLQYKESETIFAETRDTLSSIVNQLTANLLYLFNSFQFSTSKGVINQYHYRRALLSTKHALINCKTIHDPSFTIGLNLVLNSCKIVTEFITAFKRNNAQQKTSIGTFHEHLLLTLNDICSGIIIQNNVYRIAKEPELITSIFEYISNLISIKHYSLTLSSLTILENMSNNLEFYSYFDKFNIIILLNTVAKSACYEKVMKIFMLFCKYSSGISLILNIDEKDYKKEGIETKYKSLLEECIIYFITKFSKLNKNNPLVNCQLCSQFCSLHEGLKAIICSNYFTSDIFEFYKTMAIEEKEWIPETEKRLLVSPRYDQLHCILTSPFIADCEDFISNTYEKYISSKTEEEEIFYISVLHSILNNLHVSNYFHNHSIIENLVNHNSYEELYDVIDEETTIRNDLLTNAFIIGGKFERKNRNIYDSYYIKKELSKIELEKSSVSVDKFECPSNLTLDFVLNTNNIILFRNFISNGSFLSNFKFVHNLQPTIWSTNQNNSFVFQIFKAYYKKLYNCDDYLKFTKFTKNMSFFEMVILLLFNNENETALFLENNITLREILTNTNYTLEVSKEIEYYFKKEFSMHYNTYKLCGISILSVLTRWFRQCFINFLDLKEIFVLLSIIRLYGINSLIAICSYLLMSLASFDSCHEFKKESWIKHIYEPLDMNVPELLKEVTRYFDLSQ
ncbi:hypothetical protein ABK040_002400 [Willaertia magna]